MGLGNFIKKVSDGIESMQDRQLEKDKKKLEHLKVKKQIQNEKAQISKLKEGTGVKFDDLSLGESFDPFKSGAKAKKVGELENVNVQTGKSYCVVCGVEIKLGHDLCLKHWKEKNKK